MSRGPGASRRGAGLVVWLAVGAVALVGCGKGGGSSSVEQAQARVTAKEKALTKAEHEFTAASDAFCGASKTYIVAIDRYGDVLNATAPTVGDVKDAGADLAAPRDTALSGAEAAVGAHQDLVEAQQELKDARVELKQAKSGATPSASDSGTEQGSAEPTPLAPPASVDLVKSAESDFTMAQGAVTDQTPLVQAGQQFNAAAVALEMAWLRLFADVGCLGGQQEQAEAAVHDYTVALQHDLAEAGRYHGEIDGVYGPDTVAAVEALQKENGLPVTGAVDKTTAAALQSELVAQGGIAAQQSLATTAAVQQTLKLAGYWDGPVDGTWTPALTEAVKRFQTELGVKPTGSVDTATVQALEKAITASQQPPIPSNQVSPTSTPSTPSSSPTAP